jgi:hypothetical protein
MENEDGVFNSEDLVEGTFARAWGETEHAFFGADAVLSSAGWAAAGGHFLPSQLY